MSRGDYMKVLVACEESQNVCCAFRKKGDIAYSCDIQKCSGGHPEWHIQDDVKNILYDSWDLIIAFPPCTYLSNVCSWNKDLNRKKLSLEAKDFFMMFYNLPGPIAIENPVPMGWLQLPKPTQIIEPYYFGHHFTKRTCLWLHKLPPLYATEIVKPLASWVSSNRSSRVRSVTFPGVANAMAAQWSLYHFLWNNF